MDSPVTLRLDKEIRGRIATIARQRRVSTSAIIREAIHAWVERYDATASPYDGISDLLGVVHGGNPRRSSQTGKQLTDLLRNRRKQR
jgi:predicted DNA-binding protein